MNEQDDQDADRGLIGGLLGRFQRALAEYQEAKNDFETADAGLDKSRKELATWVQMLAKILPEEKMQLWRERYPDIRYVGSSLGEAVEVCLEEYRLEREGNGDSTPKGLTVAEITERLKQGGFPFRTSAPQREVHASLMRLAGPSKLPTQPPRYISTYESLFDGLEGES